MTDYYVDSNTGNNGDTGLTQALAWATIKYALESGGLSAGDDVWVRRTHAEYSGAPTSDISPIYDGTRAAPLKTIGWPRAAIPNTTITQATWTNGSTTVDLVVGVTLSRGAHQGRWATAPNGSKFLITKITDSNTFIVDREYSGPTVSSTSGAFQIEADEDYADRPTDVDGWDSDADALAVLDFGDTVYKVYISNDDYFEFKNLEFRDSSYGAGPLYALSENCNITGCLIYNDTADGGGLGLRNATIERTIIEAASTSGSGIGNASNLVLKDVAIYGWNFGIYNVTPLHLENVNIGVEVTNSFTDLRTSNNAMIKGRDVKLGSSNKLSFYSVTGNTEKFGSVAFENYGKILGDHIKFTIGQTISSLGVVSSSGDPYKRTSGADKIIQVDCSISSTLSPGTKIIKTTIFEHEFEAGTSSKSYRYYVQCKDLSLTASELWLEVEYVDSYDDTSEYTITKEESDEACSLRSGVSDWTQYIEVTGIAPATASKVRIRCFVAKYDADGYIYIDPQVVVT